MAQTFLWICLLATVFIPRELFGANIPLELLERANDEDMTVKRHRNMDTFLHKIGNPWTKSERDLLDNGKYNKRCLFFRKYT